MASVDQAELNLQHLLDSDMRPSTMVMSIKFLII